jgi:hypothetical protein
LQENVAQLGIGQQQKPSQAKKKAAPIQPAKKTKKDKPETVAPRRQSQRLRASVIDPDESPSRKRKREAEEQEKRAQQAEERLLEEERERALKRPRHHELDLPALLEDERAADLESLVTTWTDVPSGSGPRRVGHNDAFVYKDHKQDDDAVTELKEKLQNLKVVARAKVTQDRVYSAAYHPEVSKDLIFFGGTWCHSQNPSFSHQRHSLQTSTDHSESGMHAHRQKRLQMTTRRRLPSVTEKAGNTGVYKYTGRQHPNPPSHASRSTHLTFTVSALSHL